MSGRRPNLLIVGVSRAGTTALFTYLSQHPDICRSVVKEIGYFLPLRFREQTLPPLEEYERQFVACGGERYAMEATPGYFYGGRPMIEALQGLLPEPRVLVSLRDPVERLWSYYTLRSARAKIEGNPSFEDWIDRSLELRRRGHAWTREHRTLWPLSGGFYVEHVDEWFGAFGDAFRVVFFEHTVADPVGAVASLCDWLGIDRHIASSFQYGVVGRTVQYRNMALVRRSAALNRRMAPVLDRLPALDRLLRGGYRRWNRTAEVRQLDPGIRQRLNHLYRNSNAQLARHLRAWGYDRLPAWLDDIA